MKWLRSTTQSTYTFEGKVIPNYHEAPLQVADSLYGSMVANKVIKSLIDNGGILVMDKYSAPSDLSADSAKLAQLSTENARLADELRALKSASTMSEEDKAKVAQYDALKAEAQQALSDKDKEIEALKAKLAEAQEKKGKK